MFQEFDVQQLRQMDVCCDVLPGAPPNTKPHHDAAAVLHCGGAQHYIDVFLTYLLRTKLVFLAF